MQEMTGVDLHYLIKEWNLSGRVDQIYHPDDLLFRFHIPSVGKTYLRIGKHNAAVMDFKEVQHEPSSFCMALRKHIKGAPVKVGQVGSDRILCLTFGNAFFYAELFGRGRQALVDKEGNMLIGKGTYLPEKGVDAKAVDEKTFASLLHSDEPLVKVLAKDLGLGGIYAEMLVGKEKTPAKEWKKVAELHENVLGLFKKRTPPCEKNGRLYPFTIEDGTPISSFAEAWADQWETSLREEKKSKQHVAYDKQKQKLERIIAVQKKNVKKLAEDAEKHKEKGELIYKNYAALEGISSKNASSHPLVKKIQKDGTVTIDVQ